MTRTKLSIPILAFLTAASAQAQDYPGMVMPYGGIHVFVPSGFDFSATRVRTEPGPADIVVLEPRDGMVAGHPNAGFLSLTLYPFDIDPADAVEGVVDDLRDNFEAAGTFTVTPEDLYVGGEPRSGVRLQFQLGNVALQGHAAGWQMAPDLTLVAYVQGRDVDLEELRPVFQQILASVGLGATPGAPQGTGEGSESSSPSQFDEGGGAAE